MNAIYMVSAAILAMVMLQFGLQIKDMFMIVSLINVVVGIWFLCRYPSDFYLIFFKLTFKTIYNISIKLEAPLPKKGPAIVVCNHISFIDPLLVTAVMNRPPIFIMDQFYFNIRALQWFFNTARAIPIVPKKICPDGLEKAMTMVQERLNQRELIALFPEAYISKDGEIIDFKPGIEKLARDNPDAQIIPMAISGMWGSWFSRHKNGKALNGLPKRRKLRTKISINIGKPVTSEGITKENLTKIVKELRGNIK
jgi:1-acyl-sn-glycerol-3-phosphate acyltransferase